MICNPENRFIHSSEFQRSEVDVPDPGIDFFEADVLAGEGVGDADPAMLPPNAAVTTDKPDFEVPRVFQGRPCSDSVRGERQRVRLHSGLSAHNRQRWFIALVRHGLSGRAAPQVSRSRQPDVTLIQF